MTKINTHYKAPLLSLNIQDTINNITKTHDYLFVIQLNHRENHTSYPLDKIREINFEENFIEIKHNNGTNNYYNYKDITEYHIINNDDLNRLKEQ